MPSTHGIHSGQIVAAQAGMALALAAPGHPAATATAAALVTGAFTRLRQRWLHQWLRTAAGLATRRRTLPRGADTDALLALVAPGTQLREVELDGQCAAVLVDGYGVTGVLRIGELPVLADPTDLPALALPAANLRLLVTASLGVRQIELAVRIPRTDDLTPPQLRRRLGAAMRTIRRRLAPLPTTVLPHTAVRALLADLAHHDPAYPVREGWSAVRLGGLVQVTYRLPATPLADRSPEALLTLPAAAVTMAHHGSELTVRVASRTVEDARSVDATLRRRLALHGVEARRLDGEHRTGLAATLPVTGDHWRGLSQVDASGLPLGVGRRGAVVRLALFRPQPTRTVLLGQQSMAYLLARRALAAGARVLLQTTCRPGWAHGVAGIEEVALATATPATGRPDRPVLRILDQDSGEAPAGRWCADLVLCRRAETAAIGQLAGADAVITGSLPETAATAVSAALGLGRSGAWLRQSDPAMVAVISRRAVRWVNPAWHDLAHGYPAPVGGRRAVAVDRHTPHLGHQADR